MNIVIRYAGIGILVLSLGLATTQAANVVWGGVSGEYTTAGNWVGGVLPDTVNGDTAIINTSDVTFTPGGDYTINSGSGLTINGGSWSQPGANNFINLFGSLTITGGVFDQGFSGHILRGATTSITVSGGTANFTGDLAYDPANSGAISLTGGTINIGTEFKPVQDFTLSAGSLNANLISFSDGPGSILFSGGSISVDGSGPNAGFYGGGAKGLNFTEDSTGSLFISNFSLADLTNEGFLTNGTLQYDGAVDSTKFNAVATNGGVLITAVPEPTVISVTTIALAGLVFARRRSTR